MNLPLCVDPNHNTDGFKALAKLIVATGYHEALAVAVIPTKSEDESGPFVFVDVPAWTGDGVFEEFDALVQMEAPQRFASVLDRQLPILRSQSREVEELISAVGNFGGDTNRPYWTIVLFGPKPDHISAYLDHSLAKISTEELHGRIYENLLKNY